MLQFHTKKGRLTDYGLSCGYLEKFETQDGVLRLWKENGAYHVRLHCYTTNRQWYSGWPRVCLARKEFDRIKKVMKFVKEGRV